MCGIAGIVPHRATDPALLEERVRRMTKAIQHRGPDDEGYITVPGCALGMRRLSIIDVAGGHQPIETADGGLTIVFNGEIYNYRALRAELEARGVRFRTASDTEVVLEAFHHWGGQGISRLEGMFAFAIWDARAGVLTLARDWLGQKSLYWAETSLGFAFASEIKALLALDELARELDLPTLSHYMSLRYLPGTGTFFRGVSKLPAAHRMDVGGRERRTERLWTPRYEPKWSGSESQVLDGLDEVMRSVVAEHLMSEVPLGAFLSGGIDSSLVVAYAAQASSEPLRTFSVGVHEEGQSELPWARQVADRYRTRHHERIVEPDLARMAPRMVAAMEEPVDPFAAGVYLVSQVAAEQVTVALGGDGGDELFAGYDRYKGQELAEWYARLPRALRRHLIGPLLRRVPDSFGYNTFASKLRWLDQLSEKSGAERYAESAAFLRFPHARKAALFTDAAWSAVGRSESERLLEQYLQDGCAEAFVDRMLHADCMTRLADHQLPIADRMSMAHSLELRNPFLDRRVAEYAMRIPAAWKMRRRRIKYMTRRLGERYLPQALVDRPKQGFGFPLALWLRRPLRPLIERVAEESRLAEAGIFRRDEMRRLVAEHVAGAMDHNYRLWMLFNLELFWRHWIERTPVGELEDWVERARG